MLDLNDIQGDEELLMKKIFYLILFFILTGCTVGPNYHAPINQLPSHYSASTTSKTFSSHKETHFWNDSFNDPILMNLIVQALQGNNLDLQQAFAKIRQSRAELGIARADLYPQLNASGHLNRDRLSGNSEILSAFPPGIIPLSYTDYNIRFDASWELDFFGHNRRSVEAARARFQSSIESQYNAIITVAAEVARTYTQYRVYQQRILIAKHTIDSYAKTVHLVRLQNKAGSATGIDVSRVESELLSAKSALPPLEAEARATLAALAVLVGETPENLFSQLSETAPIPIMNKRAISVGLPSDLLQRRPDIKMAERTLAAATADIGVAVANEFPRFQLAGDLGYDTTKPGTYFHRASAFWSVGPNVSVPIFQGYRLKNAVKAQEAARDIAFANYKQSVLQALADVESSLIRYNRERSKNKKLLAAYHKLQTVHNLVRLQYRDGQISLMDVLDVERQLDQLNDQYVQSVGQVTIDFISLYKAVGGEWDCA